MFDQYITFYNDYFLYPELAGKLNYTGPTLNQVVSQRTQLVLSNSHSVTHEPQPFLENVVHVGGLHIKPTKPLPKDLKDFLDSSSEGDNSWTYIS